MLVYAIILIFVNIDNYQHIALTHWGRGTRLCVSKLTIIGSDNGLSPGRRQAIIRTSAGILLIGPLGTNFSEILIEIHTFSFKKMHLKMSSAKWCPFCLGLNGLNHPGREKNNKFIIRFFPNSWILLRLEPNRFSLNLFMVISVALCVSFGSDNN